MKAFAAAIELGYRHLETDARATSDGVAFAFHDSVLDRLTNDSGRFGALTAAQISQCRVMGSEPIPRLDDLIATFPDAWFNIDVKSAAAIGPVLDAVRRSKGWGRVRLAAFSHRRLEALRQAAGPTVATSLSPQEVLALKSVSVARSARLPPPLRRLAARDAHAQVPARVGWLNLVDRQFLDIAHRAGIGVDVWTVNRPTEMRRLLDLGVDGIMTDRADVLRDLMRERGQWTD
jgi:glycerophosphoryl diester phosphodiesterase